MTKEKTQAAQLVEMADAHYEFLLDESGQPHAVPKSGARIALPLSGKGALSRQLSLAFFERLGKPPNASALTGAIQVLEARLGQGVERRAVHLRSARLDKASLAIDMGDADGRVILVRNGEWKILKRAPNDLVFRRTSLTSFMPRPAKRGKLSLLRDLVNISDEGWAMLCAWLVMALIPDIPVPILALTGTQGSGKSSLGRAVVGLVDPSASPLRTPPRAADDWHTVAAASRVVGLDNISAIQPWFSDLLCRAVTGDGAAKRTLYTNDEIHVTHFRRAVVLTSIDPGSIRGDFGERVMPIELAPISASKRRSEEELARLMQERMPRILGGLLDLLAKVLANPVTPDELPRMADAGRIMAAVDAALGSKSLAAYVSAQENLSAIVLEGDPLASAVANFMADQSAPEWIGTAAQLYDLLSKRAGDHRQWPGNARALAGRLKRLQPAFHDAYKLDVDFSRKKDRLIRLRSHTPLPQKRSGVRVKRAVSGSVTKTQASQK